MVKMRFAAVVMASLLGLGLTMPSARADGLKLYTTSETYVGRINDGIPSSPSYEVSYINHLIWMANNGTGSFEGEYYTRSNNYLPGTLPMAVLIDSFKSADKPSNTSIDVTGFSYILGKYDAGKGGTYIWYVSGMTPDTNGKTLVEIPSALGDCGQGKGCGLSHYSLYKTDPYAPPVPDGGVTLMLLGGALVGLETLRRKFRS